MSTRATSLASSRAKTKLIRLLFDHTSRTPSIDPHVASFSELRSAYLERLLELHPDKHHFDSREKAVRQDHFVKLKAAWDQYETVAKIMDKTASSSARNNFTLFGVGCSFCESVTERDLRSEITDQACRGWFSSGAIEHQSRHGNVSDSNKQERKIVSLCDEDLFVQEGDCSEDSEATTQTISTKVKPSRRFLVDHPPLSKKNKGY